MQVAKVIEEVPVDSLRPDPNQPRKTFPQDIIENLAMTVKTQGTINPIEVDANNVIITGEVRWRAAKKAGLKTIPVKRISNITRDEKLERQIVENLHHSSLEPKEREEAIYGLYKSGRYGQPAKTNKETIRRLASAVGYTPGTINIIIEAKEARDRLSVPDEVPTTMLGETASLDDETRVSLLKKIQKGEIKQTNSQTQLREAVRIVRKAPEPVKKKFLKGEIQQDEAQRIVEVYEKAPEPLKRAMAKEEVEPEKAEKAVNMYENLQKKGVSIEPSRISLHVEELKKETRADRAQAKILEEKAEEVLTGKTEAFDTMILSRGHTFVREVKDVAWKVKGWGIPTMIRVGPKSWKEAQVYFKQIRDQMDFLLRAEPIEKASR
jgi:ParB/RepB/Spo0J family partition protein